MLLKVINLVSFSQLSRLCACTVKSSLTLFRGVLVIVFCFLSTLSFAAPSIESSDLVLDQISHAILPTVLDANLPVIDLNYKPIELDRLVASLPSMNLISAINEVNTADVTPPELVSLEISPREVDVTNGKQTVFVNVSVRDESDITFGYLNLHNSEYNINKYFYSYDWLYNPVAGLYETSIAIILDENVVAGTWLLSGLYISDKNGNNLYFSSGNEFDKLGLDPYVEVINRNDVDVTPPELVSLIIEPQEIDVTAGKQTVNFYLAVRDESELESTSFWLSFPELGLYKTNYSDLVN